MPDRTRLALVWTLAWIAPVAPAGATPELPSTLRIEESRQIHTLEANDLEDVVATIRARGEDGAPVVALTTSALRVSYRLHPDDAGCRVDDLALALEIAVHLPEWRPPGPVRAEMREQWGRMRTGIEIHEDGHRDIAVEAAEWLDARLRGFVPAPARDCAAVERWITRERIKAQMRQQNLDAGYDRRTRFGLTQAPPPPGAGGEGGRRPRDFRDRGQGRELGTGARR